jgi:hypothetical protein
MKEETTGNVSRLRRTLWKMWPIMPRSLLCLWDYPTILFYTKSKSVAYGGCSRYTNKLEEDLYAILGSNDITFLLVALRNLRCE